MNRLRSHADLTMRQAPAGVGSDMSRTFSLCPISHKGSTTGALWHKGMGQYIRCAACTAALKTRGSAA